MLIGLVLPTGLPQNSKNKSLQKNRTTWASVEAFAACFVANAPTIYTLYRHRRPSEQPRVKPLPPNSNLNSERGSSKKTKKSWYSKNDSLMNDTVVTMTTDTQVDGVDGKSDFHMENLVPSNRRSGTFPKNSLMRSESGEELTSPGNGTFDEERLVVRTRRDFVMQEELVECSTSERSVDLGLKQQTETRIWSVPNQ